MATAGPPRSEPARADTDTSYQPAAVQVVQSFAAELYQRPATRPGNLVCSPYGVVLALAMTRNGTRGKTAEEMDRVLSAPAPADLNAGLNALDQHRSVRRKQSRLRSAVPTGQRWGACSKVSGGAGAPVTGWLWTKRVDRPVLLVIHDVDTATPLFIGRVDDPTAGVSRCAR